MASPSSKIKKLPQKFRTQTEADKHYLKKAHLIRSQSDDPKSRSVRDSGVGAIIVADGKELASSANVLPPRLKSAYDSEQREISDSERYFVIEHAERAALFSAYQAGKDLSGATMYCTRFPCSDCARAVAWSKVARLVVPRGFKGEARWIDAQRSALSILRDSGVVVRYLPLAVPFDQECK